MASFARRALEKARAAAGRALGRLLGPSGEPASAGERGEREAARYLKRRGYRILERNYRCRLGEIDLVVFRKGVLAFVEVRTRTEPALVPAPETVTAEKRRRITRAAHDYLAQHHLGGEDVSLRFDVVAIHYRPDCSGPPRVEHIPDAFGAT